MQPPINIKGNADHGPHPYSTWQGGGRDRGSILNLTHSPDDGLDPSTIP